MPKGPAPCPHCGPMEGNYAKRDLGPGGDVRYFVFCGNCGSRGPIRSTRLSAEEAWDERYGGGLASRLDAMRALMAIRVAEGDELYEMLKTQDMVDLLEAADIIRGTA